MTETARLRLPELAAAQAQKHVTHNEALVALDTLVQLSVLDKDLSAPPGSPAEGDCYIVAAAATGAWTGWDGRVARYEDGQWRSYLPGAGGGVGWLAWVQDEDAFYVRKSGGWEVLATGGGGVTIEEGTWTPEATFQTPGDLSVSYVQQIGTYVRIGDSVFITFVLIFTPTFTTASGQFRISGLPVPVASDGLGSFQHGGANPVTYPAGVSTLLTVPTASVQQILAHGNGSGVLSPLTTTQVTSGVQRLFRGEAVYGA